MSALDILFDPIVKPKRQSPPPDCGIVREPELMSVELRATTPRSIYMQAAGDVMDSVVQQHGGPGLLDVRVETKIPPGALHLTGLVTRFYDGNEEIWVCCPRHMPPDLMRFRGRFGFQKICQLPMNHGSMHIVCWSWIDTNAGRLHALDLGLIMIPTHERFYRVFANKFEANSYYQS